MATALTIERDKRYGAALNACVVIERHNRVEAIMFSGTRAECERWLREYEIRRANGGAK